MSLPEVLRGPWRIAGTGGVSQKFTLTEHAAINNMPSGDITEILNWTPGSLGTDNIIGGLISWVLQLPAEDATSLGIKQISYDFRVVSESKLQGKAPPELIQVGDAEIDEGVKDKHYTVAVGAQMKAAIRANPMTATKGGMSMEIMLAVVLGLAIVFMMMNYKK